MKMQDKIDLVILYMKDIALKEGRDWLSPTEIGRSIGGYGKHSSYGSPICKEAVKIGLMERSKDGKYRLKR